MLLVLAIGVLTAAGTALAASSAVPGDDVVASAQGALPVPAASPDDGAGEDGLFTLVELADGEVTAERFNAFWRAEVERIETAPCPAARPGSATLVVVTLGATPPPELGPDYVDWAPVLAAARDAAATACS